jgi:hypothetical protein
MWPVNLLKSNRNRARAKLYLLQSSIMFYICSFLFSLYEKGSHNTKDKIMTDKTPEESDPKQPPLPALQFDWQLYASMLDNTDIPEDQKQEFLECLWSIIVDIIDMGIGIHPLQNNGNEDNCPENLASLLSDVIDSDHSKDNTENTKAANGQTTFAVERQDS